MNVGMIFVINLTAGGTLVTTIDRHTVRGQRALAIECFRQGPSQSLQVIELVAGEKIGMTQTTSLQGKLQQLNTLLLRGKAFE